MARRKQTHQHRGHTPSSAARDRLLLLWDALSDEGRAVVLHAARGQAKAERLEEPDVPGGGGRRLEDR